METIRNDFAARLLEAFSWMLIHSLWQGVLLAVVGALLLAVFRKSSAGLRYRLLLACFSLFVFGAVLTFCWYWSGSNRDAVLPANVAGSGSLLQLEASSASNFTAYFSRNAPVVVLIWFLVFAFRSVKVLQGMVYLHKLRHQGVSPAPGKWQSRVDALRIKLGISSKVRLLESSLLKVPMILGHFSPIILMPLGLLSGLPVGQLEAVLLHELAHIRRGDFLVNLLQTGVETVFFFNPGLLWISALLREEREHCCDEAAVGLTGNKKEFVQALVSFKEYALTGSAFQVAFPGQKNQLLARVNHVLGTERKAVPAGSYIFLAVSALLMVCLFGASLTLAQISPAPGKSKPIPAVLTSLFIPSVKTPLKLTLTEIKKMKGLTPATNKIRIAGRDTVIAPVVDSARLTAEREGAASQVRARLVDHDKSRAELTRAQTENDRQRVESLRLAVDVERQRADQELQRATKKKAEALLNKSLPLAPLPKIIEPVPKQ
jgi:bla regulator protein BlaR1